MKRVNTTRKGLSKHVNNFYFTGCYSVVKMKDIKTLQRDIEKVLIIKDHMANIAWISLYTSGNFLASFLVAAHTARN